MPTYRAGANMNVSWVYSGGTVALEGDYTSIDYTPTIDLIDEHAGGDVQKSYLTSMKDGSVSYAAKMQASGTALSNGLTEGSNGTLTISPEGTASGKQKLIIPAIAMGAKFNWPYDNVCEVSCDFQQNGTRTDTVW